MQKDYAPGMTPSLDVVGTGRRYWRTAVDDKEQAKGGPDAQETDETEDTEGNMHPGPRGAQPTSGGENPTGRDDDAGSEGENFHPRPFHPRP
jgi:hypothetical protein